MLALKQEQPQPLDSHILCSVLPKEAISTFHVALAEYSNSKTGDLKEDHKHHFTGNCSVCVCMYSTLEDFLKPSS